jgi:hypothetical protein
MPVRLVSMMEKRWDISTVFSARMFPSSCMPLYWLQDLYLHSQL